MQEFFDRFVTEGSLLNLALIAFCVVLYRMHANAQAAQKEERKLETAARKADADAQAEALTKMSDALHGVRALLEMIDRQLWK